LEFAGDTPDPEELKAKKLGSKAPVSREWTVTGVTRADPRTAPVEAQGAGSAGAAGDGDAAWRRRLAPRHREAVKRFFETGERK
jgi:hypothetical protein